VSTTYYLTITHREALSPHSPRYQQHIILPSLSARLSDSSVSGGILPSLSAKLSDSSVSGGIGIDFSLSSCGSALCPEREFIPEYFFELACSGMNFYFLIFLGWFIFELIWVDLLSVTKKSDFMFLGILLTINSHLIRRIPANPGGGEIREIG
jgi:hypothetical protein